MPQTPERKLAYNRERNRRLRGTEPRPCDFAKVSSQGGGETERGVVPGNVVPFRENVVPQIQSIVKTTVLEKGGDGNVVPSKARQYHRYAPPRIAGLTAKRLIDYLAYLRQRGYTVAETTRDYEFVDMETGEIGLWQPFVYRQAPTTKTLRERVTALEERVLRQETDQALREAMDYKTALP